MDEISENNQKTVALSVLGGVNISKMGPREREEGGFGDLQPVMKKLKLGEGEKREMEGEEEPLKGESRGVKRRHHPDTECTDSCDCEEFGLPLAKRIHGLNLLQTKGDCRTEDQGSGETEKVNESCSGGGPGKPFGTVYPFPQDAPYYSPNKLLNKLYEERVRRLPHLKHTPS